MTVIGVTMVRDEADIIETTLRHLHGEGVDHLIVADNGSTDDTPRILRRLQADGLPLTIQADDDPAYRQAEKMTALCRQAASMGATWVLPFDADELWHATDPNLTVAEALARLPVEVDTVVAEGTDHIGVGLSPWRRPARQPLPKVAVRGRMNVELAMGNHSARPAHHPVGGVLALRHFQYRSLEQMTRKVRQGTDAYKQTEGLEQYGGHWKALADLDDDGMASEWDRLCGEPGLVYDPAPINPAALPSVTIVIPTYGKPDLLDQCIAAVRATSATEIIVYNDGSGPDDAQAIDEIAVGHHCRVIGHSDNRGFAHACNAAAADATTDRICFLNNDTIPQPGWLANLNKHPAGIVGATLAYPDGRPQHTGVFFRRVEGGVLEAFNRAIPADSGLVPAVTGACFLIDRDLFDQLDGFDTSYRNGYEDVDLCLRARQAGADIAYASDSVVVHLESQTPGRFDHAPDNIALLNQRWGHLEV